MSQENVDVVRAIYAAWTEDASAGDLIASDMEYVNPPYAVETGSPRERRTLAKIRDIYPDFRVEPEQFIDAGDEVVVIGTATGTSASGIEAQWRQGYVWTIRDGRAVRFCWFNDPAEALEAAGLQP
jgi:ketosteroid isomerase-like protein